MLKRKFFKISVSIAIAAVFGYFAYNLALPLIRGLGDLGVMGRDMTESQLSQTASVVGLPCGVLGWLTLRRVWDRLMGMLLGVGLGVVAGVALVVAL